MIPSINRPDNQDVGVSPGPAGAVRAHWFPAVLLVLSLLISFIGAPTNANAQATPSDVGSESCEDFGRATISESRVSELYAGKAATGTEAQPVVDLLERYGSAIRSGDPANMSTVITLDFDNNMGWSECSGLLEAASEGPEFLYTPLRVTTDGNGTWLGFVQRSFDDGSEEGYRDVFMVVVVEDEELGLLIDFAHRDIVFENGEMTSADDIYLNGISP